MNSKVKRLILIIGMLSLASGVYQAWTSSEFMDYFPGLFIGITLIGSTLMNTETNESK